MTKTSPTFSLRITPVDLLRRFTRRQFVSNEHVLRQAGCRNAYQRTDHHVEQHWLGRAPH